MTDQDPSTTTVTAGIEPITEEFELPRFGDNEFPSDLPSEPGEEDWPTQRAKRGIRMRIPTMILIGLLLIGGGIWGGSLLQKHDGGSTASTAFAGRAAAFTRTGATGGTGSPLATTSSGTTGTVTDVIGNTLYVTESNGQLVKVTLSSSAVVTRDATSSLAALKPGDTVVVQGTKPSNGSMTASSVSATAAGVTPSRTGLGGGFGGGTGSAASS